MEKTREYRLFAVIGVLALIIAGLCLYVFIDFQTDNKAQRAREMLMEAGMNGSARALSDDIASGDMMLAYHHAAEAAEYASLAGESEAAELFGEISSEIRRGTLDENVTAVIDDFVASGLLPDEIPLVETELKEPVTVSSETYSDAQDCAARFFGGAVMTKGQLRANGDILFSVSNAYAVIDGQRCVPIEAAISLEVGEALIGEDRCVAQAMKFISDFFPKEVSRSAVVKRVDSSDVGRTDVYADACGVQMCITVRRDTGRVVRFVSSAR